MIKRDLYQFLLKWRDSPLRMPLILQGARQVGKTTLINDFSKEYDQYLYFNLEKVKDRRLFSDVEDIESTVPLLFLSRGLTNKPDRTTLIFIDEIQEETKVIEALRYFHETFQTLHIIVTGSLLDFGLRKVQRTPVGRVEYAVLHPLNFREYLRGMLNESALEVLDSIPLSNNMLEPLFDLFHKYILIGGMPRLTAEYIKQRDITNVIKLYASLIHSFKKDVEKYAPNNTQRLIIRHIMDTAAYEIDDRINLNNFGGSSYKTREIKEAIGSLEKARLLGLIYPTTHTHPPIVGDYKKRPRLHFLDIGLVNYQLGLHRELLTIKDLHDSTRGKLVQQIVCQEIKAQSHHPDNVNAFWVREQRGTTSEVDIVYPYYSMLIPIEVKAGATGKLRSLHEYMDRCDHIYAVRIYKGPISIDQLTSRKGKKYKLLNLPYFLSGWIEQYMDWFISDTNNTNVTIL